MATPCTTIGLRVLIAHAALCLSAGCSRTHTVIEEHVIEEDTTEPDEAPVAPAEDAASPSAPAEASASASHGDGAISTCETKASRDDCHTCCEATSNDAAACVKEAACEAKAPADDCRSTGCASGETCSMCWAGFVCLPSGTKC